MSTLQDELIKLKSLFDSGVLTQKEFDEQKKKLIQQYSTIEPKAPQKTKKNLLYFYLVVGVIIGGLALSRAGKSSNGNNTTTQEKKYCWRCGKDLSNTNNYIETSTGKYECTPCYEQTQQEIQDDMKAEGYK